jgi:hypothetical protein
MNPLDATSTEDKSQERTTKSFLYSNFADHRKRKKKELTFKDKEDKQSYKKGKKS